MWLGTTNPYKIQEFLNIFAPLSIPLRPVALDVLETTDTFDGNSREKALAYANVTGGLTICDDSGIVIPALGDLPGPWSAMFSDCVLDGFKVARVEPSNRTRLELDAANNELVLQMMRDIKQPYRAAKYVVHITVARPDEIMFEASGEVHGWIAEELRGTDGFGYDPIFIGQDTFGKTYAEIDLVRKNSRSHRKRALAELATWVGEQSRLGVIL